MKRIEEALPLPYRAALRGMIGERFLFEHGSITDALFVYLDGQPEDASADMLASHFAARPLVCLTRIWEEHIRTRYPGARVFRRWLMKPARTFRLPEVVEAPQGYGLAAMDEDAFARHPFGQGVNYPSYEVFRRTGAGAAAYCGGEIVSAASSFVSLDGEVELDVGTAEPHRGRGLASACAALMLKECAEKGYAVHWDAQNETSRRLAQKFGFELETIYPVYWLTGRLCSTTARNGSDTMKILVLNGSPKRERSDTLHITRAFLDGMRDAAPQEVELIHVIDKHIEYCTGCFVCMRGGVCIHDDDMRAILDDILASDLLLFSFPLYSYGMPAHLKALVDRLVSLSSLAMKRDGDRYTHVGQANLAHLRYMMICGCGFPNSRRNFEPAIAQFELLFPRSRTIITVPESPMFNAPEAAVVTAPRLELVRRAGQQYAASGAIDAALLAEICSPMIPEEQYAAIVNGEAAQSESGK